MRKTTSTLFLLVAMALCGRASAIDPADVKPVKNLIRAGAYAIRPYTYRQKKRLFPMTG